MPKHILWGCTGSVATVKVPLAVSKLLELGHEVKVVSTTAGNFMLGEPSQHYTQDATVYSSLSKVQVLHDQDEWPSSYKVGVDSVLHIELRKWADIMVIAPLSANSLAKIANGLCDNLLTCIVRCWDERKPLLLCPAMNTFMWDNAFTLKHLTVLREFKYITVIPPVSKTLACGDTGVGAMEDVDVILKLLLETLDV